MLKDLPQTKICTKCKKDKPRTEYYPRSKNKRHIMTQCKVCTNSEQRKRYEIHRERYIGISRSWKKRNPERAKEQQREWKQANPERKRELEHRRRARKQQNGVYTIAEKDMRKLSGPCAYCGGLENITIDHVIPISRGGTHGIGNLVPACSKCNNQKLDKTVMEWRMRKSRPYSPIGIVNP